MYQQLPRGRARRRSTSEVRVLTSYHRCSAELATVVHSTTGIVRVAALATMTGEEEVGSTAAPGNSLGPAGAVRVLSDASQQSKGTEAACHSAAPGNSLGPASAGRALSAAGMQSKPPAQGKRRESAAAPGISWGPVAAVRALPAAALPTLNIYIYIYI